MMNKGGTLVRSKRGKKDGRGRKKHTKSTKVTRVKKVKKIKKISKVKALQDRCERLWKDVCLERDGKECMVKKHFPNALLNHTSIIQVDHCFSRSCKHLFLHPANGTPICSGCNHPYNQKARVLIRRIVRIREGEVSYEHMEKVYTSMSANENFSKVWWLEDSEKSLVALLKYYKLPEER